MDFCYTSLLLIIWLLWLLIIWLLIFLIASWLHFAGIWLYVSCFLWVENVIFYSSAYVILCTLVFVSCWYGASSIFFKQTSPPPSICMNFQFCLLCVLLPPPPFHRCWLWIQQCLQDICFTFITFKKWLVLEDEGLKSLNLKWRHFSHCRSDVGRKSWEHSFYEHSFTYIPCGCFC